MGPRAWAMALFLMLMAVPGVVGALQVSFIVGNSSSTTPMERYFISLLSVQPEIGNVNVYNYSTLCTASATVQTGNVIVIASNLTSCANQLGSFDSPVIAIGYPACSANGICSGPRTIVSGTTIFTFPGNSPLVGALQAASATVFSSAQSVHVPAAFTGASFAPLANVSGNAVAFAGFVSTFPRTYIGYDPLMNPSAFTAQGNATNIAILQSAYRWLRLCTGVTTEFQANMPTAFQIDVQDYVGDYDPIPGTPPTTTYAIRAFTDAGLTNEVTSLLSGNTLTMNANAVSLNINVAQGMSNIYLLGICNGTTACSWRNSLGAYSVTTVPAQMPVPTFTSLTYDSVTVLWSIPAGTVAKGYTLLVGFRVENSTDMVTWSDVPPYLAPYNNPTGTSATACGLNYNTQYYFRISVRNNVGFSPVSGLLSILTPCAVPDAPAAPTVSSPVYSPNNQWTINFVLATNVYCNGTSMAKLYGKTSAQSGFQLLQISTSLSFLHQNLVVGTQYMYMVSTVNAGGVEGANSSVVAMSFTASAPTLTANLTFTGVTATSITVQWAAATPNGAAITAYTLERTTQPPSMIITLINAGMGFTMTTFTDSNVTAGVTYNYRYTAINLAGSTTSVYKFVTAGVTPPHNLTVMTFTQITNTSATLVLGTVGSNGGATVTAFAVMGGRVVDSPTSYLAFSMNTMPATIQISSLSANTQYQFQWAARNSAGDSDYTPMAMFTTAAGVPYPIGTATVSNVTKSSCTVTWTAPANNGGSAITAYLLWATPASTGVSEMVLGAADAFTGLSYTVYGLMSGEHYTFVYAALNGVGASSFSVVSNVAAVMADVPEAPTGLRVVETSVSSAEILCTGGSAHGANITRYTLERSVGDSGFEAYRNSSDCAFNDNGLVTGTSYQYRAAAVNSVGVSDYSAAVTFVAGSELQRVVEHKIDAVSVSGASEDGIIIIVIIMFVAVFLLLILMFMLHRYHKKQMDRFGLMAEAEARRTLIAEQRRYVAKNVAKVRKVFFSDQSALLPDFDWVGVKAARGFQMLIDVLMAPGHRGVLSICDTTESARSLTVARSLVFVTDRYQTSVKILCALITEEVNATTEANQLFRTNSMTTKCWQQYAMLHGLGMMRMSLFELIKDNILNWNQGSKAFGASARGKPSSDSAPPAFQGMVDDREFSSAASMGGGGAANYNTSAMSMSRMESMGATTDDSDSQRQAYLINTCQRVVDAFIIGCRSYCPIEIKLVLQHVRATVAQRFPEAADKAVGSFFFLRFACPAITTPVIYGLVDDAINEEQNKNFLSVSKVIILLANETSMQQKQNTSAAMIAFVEQNKPKLRELYNIISECDPHAKPVNDALRIPETVYMNAMAQLHIQVCNREKDICQSVVNRCAVTGDNPDRLTDAVHRAAAAKGEGGGGATGNPVFGAGV